MMIVPAGVKVHLALGYTDMRKGMDGLAMLVQKTLSKDAFSGHLFVFRGKQAQHTTFRIQFTLREDRISLASPVRAEAAGLSLPSRQGAEMHLHGREV